MTILGLSGAIGSGKSFTQLKVALEYCERKQKQLVTNFPVNTAAIHRYARMKKYKWVQYLCTRDAIVQMCAPKNLEALLIPESVVCLDEAGIFLNSREFMNTSKQLLADLAQSRKDGVDLVWAAQFNEQVDKQFRLLTQYWIHCDSISFFDKKLRRPRLFWKRIYWFSAWDYNYWVNDPRARSSHFKTRYAYSFSYEGGWLNAADLQIFKAFDSFNRLDRDNGSGKIKTLQRCDLPVGYYFDAKPIDLSFTPASAKSEVSQLSTDKTVLIRQALAIARQKNLKAPYFRSLTTEQIQTFIKTNSLQ